MGSNGRPDQARAEADGGPCDETEEVRERYRELLEEVRVIIPGIQVLFAFLLTVPFSSRFTKLDTIGTALFVASLAATVALWYVLPLIRRVRSVGHGGNS